MEALKCEGLIKKPQIYSPHSAKENAMSGFMSLTWIYVLVWGKIVVTSTINVLFLYILLYIFVYLRYITHFYIQFIHSIIKFYQSQLSEILLIKFIDHSFCTYLVAYLYFIGSNQRFTFIQFLGEFPELILHVLTKSIISINEIKNEFYFLHFIIYHANVTE